MRCHMGILFLLTAVLIFGGCGGSGPDQTSSLVFDMTLLDTEGEHFIQGTVFNDLNGSGTWDTGEPGMEGVHVELSGGSTSSTVTDSMGMYSFAVSPARAYTVTSVLPAGFVPATSNPVNIFLEDENMTADFGIWNEIPSYAIHGYVFEDLNMDGIMDVGEPGIPGVTVNLAGMSFTTTTTLMDGQYFFASADTGSYTVEQIDAQGYVSITPNEVMVEIVDGNERVDFGDLLAQEIEVDVKPGSDVSPLNLRSKGVLPVAILGSAEFDVALIDPASLLLNGVSPLRWNYTDVGNCEHKDADPDENCCDDEIPDDFGDLILKFSTPEIAASLPDAVRGDIVTLTMTGYLMDGTTAYGEETVWIVQGPK